MCASVNLKNFFTSFSFHFFKNIKIAFFGPKYNIFLLIQFFVLLENLISILFMEKTCSQVMFFDEIKWLHLAKKKPSFNSSVILHVYTFNNYLELILKNMFFFLINPSASVLYAKALLNIDPQLLSLKCTPIKIFQSKNFPLFKAKLNSNQFKFLKSK